jgi:hypothetical protein
MFEITKDQWAKIAEWKKEQDEKVRKSQEGTFIEHEDAYYGCLGGGYSYRFTPTSLGTGVVVINNLTKEELNVTDYDSW